MPALLRRALVGGLALALGAILLVGAAPERLVRADAAPSLPTSARHPYSDPTWFPLRAATKVGCARSGCGTSADHGFDAIDLTGRLGDPVYAAGAGVAHIGGNAGGCSGTGEVVGGRWIWVDHGGGVVSRYHHLDTLLVKEGQLVTPATKIGTMGHSGDVPPCTFSYLHFEVRHGGVYGQRVDFGPLRGCGPKGALRLPQALGFSSWNAPGLHPKKRLTTPVLTSGCLTRDWMTTASSSPAPQVARSAGAVRVALAVPAKAQTWAANLEIWRPSLDRWRPVKTAILPASRTRTTLAAPEDDHRYRVRVAVHQGQGWSRWSTTHQAVGRPRAPGVRYLQWKRTTSSSKSYLHYGWTRPDALGSPVTGYSVSRRCGSTAASLGPWKTITVSAKKSYKNLRKLKKAKVCDVRARATNAVGDSPWSAPRRITR